MKPYILTVASPLIDESVNPGVEYFVNWSNVGAGAPTVTINEILVDGDGKIIERKTVATSETIFMATTGRVEIVAGGLSGDEFVPVYFGPVSRS